MDSVLITVALPLVNVLIMCGIGMTLRPADFRRVVYRPKAVAFGVAGQYLLLPPLGFLFGWLYSDSFGYAVGFVLLAACPSASVSNALTYLARGNVALAVTLTAVCSVATLASIPLLVNLAMWWFGGEVQSVRLPAGRTVAQLAVLILLPIVVGMTIRRYAPRFSAWIEPMVGRLSLVFLLLLVAVIALDNAELVKDSVGRLGPATLAMCTMAIVCGLLMARLGRLPMADAISIGMEVGVQNCMLAMLVALTILRTPEVGMPAAIYGLMMYMPAFVLVLFGRRAAVARAAMA